MVKSSGLMRIIREQQGLFHHFTTLFCYPKCIAKDVLMFLLSPYNQIGLLRIAFFVWTKKIRKTPPNKVNVINRNQLLPTRRDNNRKSEL